MKASHLTLLAGATLAMSLSLASLPAGAQQSPGSGAGAPSTATPGAREARPPRPEIFTPEERERFRQRMNEAKTPEERDAVRRERRAAEEARAKEKGITLPRRPAPRSGDSTDKRGDMRGGKGDSSMGERGPMAQLLTQEDRDQYRKSMQNAKTPEERAKVRSDMRATVEQRAKDKGVKLPEHRPGPRHGPRAFEGKDGSAPAAPAAPATPQPPKR